MTDSYGTIIDVSTTNVGEVALADSLIGVSTLTVANAWAFDEQGGQIRVNGLILRYLTVNAETGIMTLESPLPADVLLDDVVEVYPLAPVKMALVDFGIPDSEAVAVTVPHSMVAVLPDGMREDADREVVLVEERTPGELVVKDIAASQPTIELATLPDEVLDNALDGNPPAMSPNPVVEGMVGALHVHWEAITNHDLVTYEVHISETGAFTPDETTLSGETTATALVIRTLPTDLLLAHGTTYYVKIVATDGDGAASPSVEDSGQLVQVTNADIAANVVYAGRILASQIDSGEVSATLVISGAIKTAETGGRTEVDPTGVTVYDSAGDPGTHIGPDQSFFKGDAEIGGLTVKDSMSVRGMDNELSTGAELELATGVTGPSTAPSLTQTWDSVTFTKSGDAGFNAANIMSFSLIGSDWWTMYDDGGSNRYYLFDSAGAFISETDDTYVTVMDNVATKITAGGRVYTMKQDGSLIRHKADAADYSYIFTDEFATEINATTWPTRTSATWDAGRAKLSVASGLAEIRTGSRSIEDRFVSAKLARSGVSNDGQSMVMQVLNSSNGVLAQIAVIGTSITFSYYDGSGFLLSSTGITYSATTHAYWKIAEDAGQWRWSTSPDGITWTERFNEVSSESSGTLAAVKFRFYSNQNGGVGTQIVHVDDVKHGLINDDLLVAYSRYNTTKTPALGHDGTNLLVAETHGTNNTVRIQTLNPTTLAVTATVTTPADSGFANARLAGILKGNFDFGASRFVFKKQGALRWYSVNSSGALQLSEEFSADNGGSRAIGWDGTNFWGLGTDGKIYKHPPFKPAGATPLPIYYFASTWYDSNATGGTHETAPSPQGSVALIRRAKTTLTAPAIPPGSGSDMIDSARFYMGPSAVSLTLQSTTAPGDNSAVYTSGPTTGGAAPPGSGNFPGSTPAKITNDAGTLEISGDGSIKASSIMLGAVPLSTQMPLLEAFGASGTWTKPTGARWVRVQVVGGGGAGGGAAVTSATQSSAGSGGEGGGYAESYLDAASLAATVAVTVGAAGAAVSAANGGNGGQSSFGTHVIASGGEGGLVTSPATTAGVQEGGQSTQSLTGQIEIAGGGGGAGGRLGDNAPLGGAGGDSAFGKGGGGQGAHFTGITGRGPGGGGSGASNGASQAARAGGNGGSGRVIVTTYF